MHLEQWSYERDDQKHMCNKRSRTPQFNHYITKLIFIKWALLICFMRSTAFNTTSVYWTSPGYFDALPAFQTSISLSHQLFIKWSLDDNKNVRHPNALRHRHWNQSERDSIQCHNEQRWNRLPKFLEWNVVQKSLLSMTLGSGTCFRCFQSHAQKLYPWTIFNLPTTTMTTSNANGNRNLTNIQCTHTMTCHWPNWITLANNFHPKKDLQETERKRVFDNWRMLSTLIFDRKQMRILCQKFTQNPKSWAFKKPSAFNNSAKRLEEDADYSAECGIVSCNLKNASFHFVSSFEKLLSRS